MATLRNVSADTILSESVNRAATLWQRTIGFLLTPSIRADSGMWFEGCRAIHTVGMRSSIDVIFLDREQRVIALEAGVRPNRPSVSRRRGVTIVEFGPGFLDRHAIAVGDLLELI